MHYSVGPLIRNFLNKKSPALFLRLMLSWGRASPPPDPLPRALRAEMNLIRTLYLLGAQRSWEGVKASVLRNRLAIWKSCFLMTGPTLYVLSVIGGGY